MKMSPVRKPAPLRLPGLRPGVRLAVVAIGLLSAGGALTGSVLAQRAGASSAKADAAHAAWRKLSQSEVNCVDKALLARNSQIWQLIQRGVGPGDSSVAAVRAACRKQTAAQGSSTTPQDAPPARAVQAPRTSAADTIAAQPPATRTPGGEPQVWSFNGSLLSMVVEGGSRKFFYAEPGPDAEAAGAKRGDLVLEANVSDRRIVGFVYGHDGRCGRIPYRVDGSIRDDNRRLELQGQKPHVDGNCTVVGTVLDALTLTSADQSLAAAQASPAAKPPASRPAFRPASRPDIERAADLMAAADRATAETAGNEDAAEFKTVPEKAPAERQPPAQSAAQAMPVRVVMAATSESKIAVNEAVAEKASAGAAVEISRAEAARAQAQAEQARSEAEKAIAEAIATAAQAQAKIGFIYGLMCGPALLGAGAAVFLLLRRRNRLRLARSEADAELDGVAEQPILSLQH
jgi:hypothetical protein